MTPSITELSIEAQVLYAGYWQMMKKNEVTFQRPWVISEKAKKGLDELVASDYLTCEKFDNPRSDAIVYKATEKMRDEKKWYSREFLEEHGRFNIIDERKDKK